METANILLVIVANEIITILFTSDILESWYKTLAFNFSKTLQIDLHCLDKKKKNRKEKKKWEKNDPCDFCDGC